MSTFQDRLNSAIDEEKARRKEEGEKRLFDTELWKAAGVTSGAMSQWRKGITSAKMDNCLKMAPLLRVNPWWLFDESRPKTEGIDEGIQRRQTRPSDNRTRFIAPEPIDPSMEHRMAPTMKWKDVLNGKAPAMFKLMVEGNSMIPDLCPEEVITVDQRIQPVSGDFVIVSYSGGKGDTDINVRLYSIEGNKEFVAATNLQWNGNFHELPDSAKIIGVVISRLTFFRRRENTARKVTEMVDG
jgi:SOS-response transcriptional repressor LexA